MIRSIVISVLWCVWAQTVCAQTKLTEAQMREMYDEMIPVINHSTLAYRAAAMQKMLVEANYFADRLKLPTPHPIQISDTQYEHISPPWFSVLHETGDSHYPVSIFGSNIFNSNIPREARLRALQIAAGGTIETTNFVFSFYDGGKIREVLCLDEHDMERYAKRLDELIGKPSLINEAQAHELATQWLAAVDVDVAALDKRKWTVNQLHYTAHGATNAVTLPLYYVSFGSIHYTNGPENRKEFDEPIVEVEILGTTKELQNLTFNDLSFSRRPLLIITNALDLIRTPDPSVKELKNPF
jgi:hypothetical protein